MLRVQNQAKQAVSSGLSLEVVVARGDLQVAQSSDQTKIHNPPAPYAGTSREPITEWDAPIEAGAIGQGKSMKKEAQQAVLRINMHTE
jgi:beta-lactam-binding protein with PASTA domain